MAEGFLNALYGDRYEGSSAGVEPAEVDPYTVTVMAETGIDISRQRSKSIEEFRGRNFDYVITVCDHARETCPFFPGERVLHKAFKDPAEFIGSEDEKLANLRRVRDEIKDWLEETFGRETHSSLQSLRKETVD